MLAGLCIAIGGTVFMRVGGVAGAVLFSFGLTTVVYYGLRLYTGTAGFIRRSGDWGMLSVVLLGNIVGCLLTALAVRYAHPDLVDTASGILAGRMAKGALRCFLLAVGCGFIMTTAVFFARQGKVLPLLLGVPVRPTMRRTKGRTFIRLLNRLDCQLLKEDGSSITTMS